MTFYQIRSDPPEVQVDLIYATAENFTGKTLYDAPIFALIGETIEALKKAKQQLAAMGFGLLLWDGYRPFATQVMMWDMVQNERYVSDPHKTGGRHTRGTAVDLTLTDRSGHPLQMPTRFDDFTDKASYAYQDLPEEVLARRTLLKSVMEACGFVAFHTEWWHFDLQGWEGFPPQHVPLSTLQNAPLVKL